MTRWVCFSAGLTAAAFAGAFYVYFGLYDRLPEQVPTHWNAHGEANGWLPREKVFGTFLLVPAAMAVLVALTVVLPWLSPKPFTVDTFRAVFGYVMFLAVALLGFIQATLLWASLEQGVPLVRLFIGVMFLFFMLIGNVMGQVRRNFWMGVRTPWTLANDHVWVQTHRLAAWLFVTCGFVGCILVLAVPGNALLVACTVALLVVILIPVPYSLVLYKRLEREGRL
jgi:uncharacterized membrane protein